MKLEAMSACDFDGIYAQMEENFIVEERRDRADAKAVLEDPAYEILHLIDGQTRVGFVGLWHLEGENTFLEHFVIYAAYRGRGYGAKALRLLQDRFARLVLEAEYPKTEIAARRVAFYQRNGFFKNDFPYVQPSYRKGGEGVPLLLMSYPTPLADPARVARLLQARVYKVRRADLVLDTDFGSDCDDAMAIAYLMDAAHWGAVDLKAIAHSNGCAEGADAIRTFFSYMGEPAPPIGIPATEMTAYDHYCKQILERFGDGQRACFEDAVTVMRRALCESENAVLCAVGAMTNVAALLKSKGDDISPLDGVSLVRERCREIVLMAGIFDPKETRIEWNIHLDIAAAKAVAELSPVPIVWLPSETGAGVITGGPMLAAYGDGNPLGLSFSLFPGVIKRGGRPSWDPASALYAVEGTSGFFEKSASGTVTVDVSGRTTFTPDPAGTHFVLHLRSGSADALAACIDRRAVRLFDMTYAKKALAL